MNKLAIREVHVGIREELSVERATFHVDGAGVLETVVVYVTPIKCNVLKSRTIRHTCDTAV